MQLTFRITGLLLSLVCTLIAYFLILYPSQFYLSNEEALLAIFGLAAFQALVQLICFINLWREKGPLWNLYVFLSTAATIFIILFFSIWIMAHLNENMMPEMMPHH